MSPPTGRAERRRALACFLAPTALALAVILPGLGRRQLWFDEYATWWATTLSYRDFARLTDNIDIVFVPFYTAMRAWTWLAGVSEAALRLPEALAMGVSAGLVALVGRRLLTTRAGVVAGLLFALVPTVTRYGQEARPYAFAMLFALTATLLLLRALDRPCLRTWAGYTAAVALTGFSHMVALAVLAAHALAVAHARRGGDAVAPWAFGCAALVGTSCVLPMVYRGTAQSGQIAWNDLSGRRIGMYGADLFGSWVAFGVVLVLVLLGAGAVRRLAPGRGALPFLAVWALLPAVATALTGPWLHLFLPRYLLFTVPAWTLLAAVGAVRCHDVVTGEGRKGLWWWTRGVLMGAAASALLAVPLAPALGKARQDLVFEPDYAGAARVVKAAQRPGDAILYHRSLSSRMALAYQLRDGSRPRDVLMKGAPQKRGWFEAYEYEPSAERLAGAARVWFVAPGDDGASTPKAKALRHGFAVVRTERLHLMTVQLLERRPHSPGAPAAAAAWVRPRA
ncbi:glycosyltransferase family 39 protein [Streptomyces sp. NPDC053755]|uniref:glycosyltransferase family 39 protein n=1 Tax=Streptomyces sp. NPDC053755 TaxID=3155815 RepID=UPI003445FFB0